MVHRLIWTFILAFVLSVNSLSAQVDSTPKPKVDTVFVFSWPYNAVAVTRCLDDKVFSWMNMEYMDDMEFAKEVAVHEAKHREQFHRYGTCEEWDRKWENLNYALDQEAEAYCAGLEYFRSQGKDISEKWQEYLKRLEGQFQSNFALGQYYAALYRYCKPT